MSHSVTITRTVTTSNTTSTLVLNTGYIKTLPGLLKLAQLVIKTKKIHCALNGIVNTIHFMIIECRLLELFVLESWVITTTTTAIIT